MQVFVCTRREGEKGRRERRREEGRLGGSARLPNVFPGCVTARKRWAGQREVPSRNRESDVSSYTSQLKEGGKAKWKK